MRCKGVYSLSICSVFLNEGAFLKPLICMNAYIWFLMACRKAPLRSVAFWLKRAWSVNLGESMDLFLVLKAIKLRGFKVYNNVQSLLPPGLFRFDGTSVIEPLQVILKYTINIYFLHLVKLANTMLVSLPSGSRLLLKRWPWDLEDWSEPVCLCCACISAEKKHQKYWWKLGPRCECKINYRLHVTFFFENQYDFDMFGGPWEILKMILRKWSALSVFVNLWNVSARRFSGNLRYQRRHDGESNWVCFRGTVGSEIFLSLWCWSSENLVVYSAVNGIRTSLGALLFQSTLTLVVGMRNKG